MKNPIKMLLNFLCAFYGIKNFVEMVEVKSFELPRTKWGKAKAAQILAENEFEDVHFTFYWHSECDLRDRAGTVIALGIIVLSTLPNPDANVEAYLLIPQNHGKAVVRMNKIIEGCTDNEYVAITTIELDAASELVENYNKAHGAARKVKLDLAVAALEVFMAQFQAFANLPVNKANSIVILQSANFHVKGIGGGHASTWDALTGQLAGEVDMTFITGEGTCCYDVWHSIDDILWIRDDPTIYNHATLTGLIPGSYVWVRYQLCDAHGPEGFHPAIRVRVQANP